MRREYMWALATLVMAIALAYILLSIARDDASPQTQRCVDHETRERIRNLSLDGYDEALKAHTAKLFSIWISDEHDQPKRAQAGTQKGINAYIRSRELAMAWLPPEC
jgi:hypothetical protein